MIKKILFKIFYYINYIFRSNLDHNLNQIVYNYKFSP